MFYLPKDYADAIISHARSLDPIECCGLIAGREGKPTRLYRTTNIEASPTRYTIAPGEELQILKEMDDNDWEVVAIYHSHTHTQAYPSETDVQRAHWEEPLYIIVSLEDKANPVLRAFHIREGKVTEEEVSRQ